MPAHTVLPTAYVTLVKITFASLNVSPGLSYLPYVTLINRKSKFSLGYRVHQVLA